MRILVVEDEILLAESIAEALEMESYAVDMAHDGNAAAKLKGANAYDLIVLDWRIPSPNGIELLAQWRRVEDRTPVLMLTGLSAVSERIKGLEAGADDYLTKPFSLEELLARARGLLRRGRQVRLDETRKGFEHLLAQAIAQADRTGEGLALHFLRLGCPHARILSAYPVARLDVPLRALVRRSDAFARLDARTFGVLQRSVVDLDGVTTFARKMIDTISAALVADGAPSQLTASVGIALHRPGVSIQHLMASAEQALHEAEAAGGHAFRYEQESALTAGRSQLLLQYDLQRALDRGEFFLEFQPQVDSASGRTRCIEALVRWQHPKLGVVAPGEFIALAERTGLIAGIGKWVQTEASRQCSNWNRTLLPGVPVAINVSPAEIDDGDFPDRLIEACGNAGLEHGMLELELTERALVSGGPVSQKVLEDIRAAGFSLSIDDFGTGYCSLQYLKAFPAKKLKIPAEFVTNVTTDPSDRAIVEASVRLAHGLQMLVVAEGVETLAQAEMLHGLACDTQQGFFFARPSRDPHRHPSVRRAALTVPGKSGASIDEFPLPGSVSKQT